MTAETQPRLQKVARWRKMARSSPAGEHRAESAEFLVDGRGGRFAQGIGDGGAERGAKAVAEAGQRLAQRGVAHAELRGERSLIGKFVARAEEGTKSVENRRAIRVRRGCAQGFTQVARLDRQ